MKLVYSRFRIALMAFALALAAVYMFNGISIWMNTIPVDLPKINTEDEVLFIFPSTAHDASRFYVPKEGEITDGRDLSIYEEGGYIESCEAVDDNERASCRRQRESARQFVFDHWAEKRRGYIKVGHPCVDCAPVDHVFIEPGSGGEFRIVITLENGAPPRTQEGVRVRFRRANEEERWRADSAKILVFVDQNGKEIDYF